MLLSCYVRKLTSVHHLFLPLLRTPCHACIQSFRAKSTTVTNASVTRAQSGLLQDVSFDPCIGRVEVEASHHRNNFSRPPSVQIVPNLGSKVGLHIVPTLGQLYPQGWVMFSMETTRVNPVPRSDTQKRRTAPPHCEERRPRSRSSGLRNMKFMGLGFWGLGFGGSGFRGLVFTVFRVPFWDPQYSTTPI